jgi:hypothetical protein
MKYREGGRSRSLFQRIEGTTHGGAAVELTELERIVGLQQKAYGLLLWLKEQARRKPTILNPEQMQALSSGDSCVEWVKHQLNDLPHEFGPKPDEFRAFGYLFSSFFTTSFRVGEVRNWDVVETTLIRGAKKLRGRRHKRHSERREREAADELKLMALVALAEEHGLAVTSEVQERALAAADLALDLALWTYGCELVRRARFASQGGAVHRLWLELKAKTRKNLSAESIWRARERLVRWLARHQAGGEG